jgi:CheY-like chemotaxis protein
MVVDGSADAAESLALVLRSNGYRVTVATSGEDALRAAEAAVPDVVLLDRQLPGLDGWEVARLLRGLTEKKCPPLFVAITGCARTADRQRSAEAGVDLHLLKPVDPHVLVTMLNQFSRLTAAR